MAFVNIFAEPKPSRHRFNKKDKARLHTAQNGKCNGCGFKFPIRDMTVDHIRPLSKGGSDEPYNLQLLCGPCNLLKGDGTQAQLENQLEEKKHATDEPRVRLVNLFDL